MTGAADDITGRGPAEGPQGPDPIADNKSAGGDDGGKNITDPGTNGRFRRFAEVLSVVFHPIFMPLYGLLIIYTSHTLHSFVPAHFKRMIFILVMANNILMPMALATVLYARGAITTFNARDRNERMILLTFAMVMYSVTAFILLRVQIPSLFKAYFISIAVVTFITLLITVFYRISLHASGIGGLLVLVVFMIILYHNSMVWQTVAVLLTGGAVMSSRIYLGDHSPSEVWTGLLAGVLVMGVSLLFILK
jgi:hypothetical protein